ncbi:MAG: GHMP kinase [Actinomycetes bacterium]
MTPFDNHPPLADQQSADQQPADQQPADPSSGSTSDLADTTLSLSRGPIFLVRSSAPTRTADVGGWTDTWFAHHGTVCNIAIDHRARVRVQAQPGRSRHVRLRIRMTGEDYQFDAAEPPGRHPIIEHAVVAADIPGAVEVDLDDSILAGWGLGTSASVLVALVAALAAAIGDPLDAGETAALAHLQETVTGKQSGIQDHAAAAWGGISRYDVRYPSVRREQLAVPDAAFAELSARLHTVYLGTPHASSALHDEVIARLDAGHGEAELEQMRTAAADAADALVAGRLDRYGRALMDAHDAIGSLHAGLVGDAARDLIGLASDHGARGWKVNGAGGSGGSVAVLGPADPAADAALVAAVRARPGWSLVDAALGAPGVRTSVSVIDLRSGPDDLTGEVTRR